MSERYPLVSVCCLTYNHARFIRTCLDGFLMQVPPETVADGENWMEILIHDDCSTDGTQDIIREYESKFPGIIFPIYETENQYSRGGAGKMDLYNYERARGKYIAYCEGDDYWTDSEKLRKQLEFMESHPEYSVCFHDRDVFDTVNEQIVEKANPFREDFDIDPVSFLYGKSGGQPLTMLFRRDMYDFSWRNRYSIFLDTQEIYHLLLCGKGRFLAFNGGQYNLHGGGVCTSMSDLKNSGENCRDFTEIYAVTKDRRIIPLIRKNVLWMAGLCRQKGDYSLARKTLKRMFGISPSLALQSFYLYISYRIKHLLKR